MRPQSQGWRPGLCPDGPAGLVMPLGVIDGVKTKGLETEGDIKWRKDFLRKIGYKL